MKKLLLILSFSFIIIFLQAQDIRFSNSVVNSGATSTVSVFMEKITAGPENISGITVVYYYDNTETTLTGWNLNPLNILGWNIFQTSQNFVSNINPALPPTFIHTGYGEMNVIDQFNTGTNLDIGMGKVHIMDISFNHGVGDPSLAGDGYLASTAENHPALQYSDNLLNGFDVIVIGAAQQSLPLELLFFNAKPKVNHIALEWASERTINFEGFELQRSEDGISFQPIHFIKGIDSEDFQNYNYQDFDVVLGQQYYYRIRMIDSDGEYEYSPIRQAKLNAKNYFSVYPNPTSNILNLEFYSEHSNFYNAKIIDLNGKMISDFSIESQEGLNTRQIDCSNYIPGEYFLFLEDGAQSIVKPFIVGK